MNALKFYFALLTIKAKTFTAAQAIEAGFVSTHAGYRFLRLFEEAGYIKPVGEKVSKETGHTIIHFSIKKK